MRQHLDSAMNYRVDGERIEIRLEPTTPSELIEAMRAVPGFAEREYLERRYISVPLSAIEAVKNAARGISTLHVPIKRRDRPSIPDGVQLYPHQGEGVQFLLERESAMLADDMGLGKTIQAILAALAVGGKTLVVAPAGLVGNWTDEIRKFAGLEASVLRTKSWSLDARFCVASVDTLKRFGDLRDAVLRERWSTMIIDEAQLVKNVESQRCLFVCQVNTERRWLLTGTPMVSRPMDLYGMLEAARHQLSLHMPSYIRRFAVPDVAARYASMALGLELANWILRRKKADVLSLPGKSEADVFVSTREYTPSGIGDLSRMRAEMALEKAPSSVELALEAHVEGSQVLIFSNFRKPLDYMREQLGGMGLRIGEIRGGVTMKKRKEVEDEFQKGEIDVILGQIKAAGVGLNLTAASTVIFNDLSYVPADHSQAADRADRIGQDKVVSVYRLLSDSHLDQATAELLAIKERNIGAFEEGADTNAGAAIAPTELLQAIRDRIAKEKE